MRQSRKAFLESLVEDLRNVLPETKCSKCGKCCGPVMITPVEINDIVNYLMEHKLWKIVIDNLKSKKDEINIDKKMICPLQRRNERDENECIVYPVRPIVCREFGVIDNRWMTCPNHGTLNIHPDLMDVYQRVLRQEPYLLTDILLNIILSEQKKLKDKEVK